MSPVAVAVNVLLVTVMMQPPVTPANTCPSRAPKLHTVTARRRSWCPARWTSGRASVRRASFPVTLQLNRRFADDGVERQREVRRRDRDRRQRCPPGSGWPGRADCCRSALPVHRRRRRRRCRRPADWCRGRSPVRRSGRRRRCRPPAARCRAETPAGSSARRDRDLPARRSDCSDRARARSRIRRAGRRRRCRSQDGTTRTDAMPDAPSCVAWTITVPALNACDQSFGRHGGNRGIAHDVLRAVAQPGDVSGRAVGVAGRDGQLQRRPDAGRASHPTA